MKAYFPEGMLELPDGWKDQTVNVYIYGPSEGRVSAVRTREDATVPFDAYCRHVASMIEKNLPAYRPLGEQILEKDGLRAFRLEFTWRRDEADIYQIQLVVEHGGSFVVFSLTAPLAERALAEHFEKQMLGTIRFRTPQSLQ
jgi:hypothetical protein